MFLVHVAGKLNIFHSAAVKSILFTTGLRKTETFERGGGKEVALVF